MNNTYLELPFLISGPIFCHACDNTRPAALLIAIYKLFNAKFIYIYSFNCISKGLWIMNF